MYGHTVHTLNKSQPTYHFIHPNENETIIKGTMDIEGLLYNASIMQYSYMRNNRHE